METIERKSPTERANFYYCIEQTLFEILKRAGPHADADQIDEILDITNSLSEKKAREFRTITK